MPARLFSPVAVLVILTVAAPPPACPVSHALAARPSAAAFRSGLFNDVSSLSATSAWAVGLTGPSRTQYTLVARWAQVPSPSPGGANSSQLLGVASTPKSGAWAVGSANGATLALRWNGTRWARVPAPSPGASDCLTAVTAVSASDAWAVGWTAGKGVSAPHRTLVLHWNGTRWARVASPSPPLASSELTGVSAISAASAWAVGDAVHGNHNPRTLTLHWNGTRWLTVPSPSPGSSVLYGVSDVSARDALAVGTGSTGVSSAALILRWNGSRWVIS